MTMEKDFIETSAAMEMEEITRMKSREEFTAKKSSVRQIVGRNISPS
jgi:hypothetical protein